MSRVHTRTVAPNPFAWCLVALLLNLAPHIARGQSAASLDPTTTKLLEDAAKQGIPVKSKLTVADNVSVESLLLPASVCKKLFGKEISNNYAAVELIVSNRSDNASLIVQTIFIDYSQWALGGYYETAPVSTAGTSKPTGNEPQSWQAGTSPSQVASAEYRIPRGELLDAQPWTFRNITIRALQAVGSIASAYTFTIGGQHAVRSIGAFNGQVVPAIDTFWPDATIGQMNRISDLGFQVNKVVAKESSDIIVAFFPIDRFLTPGLKKLFLKNPSMFFAPYEMLIDPQARAALKQLITPFFENQDCGVDKDNNKIDCAEKFMTDVSNEFVSGKRAKNLEFLDRLSLNTIRVLVGGIMTVDVNKVPATITSIVMDGGNDNGTVWTLPKDEKQQETPSDRPGVIKGSYLAGGVPTIVGPAQNDVTNVAVASGSTASALPFKMKLAKSLAPGQKLTFKVTKKDGEGKDIDSTPFEFTIPTFQPQITSIDFDGDKGDLSLWSKTGDKTGTIKGSFLQGGVPSLVGADSTVVSSFSPVKDGSTDSALKFQLTLAKPLTSGQKLTFKVTKKDSQDNDVDSASFEFAVPTSKPEITSVEFTGENGDPSFWTKTGDKTGTIDGSSLQDGVPSLVGVDPTVITSISPVKGGSTDSIINFKLTLAKPLPAGQKLTFKVTKKNSQGKSVESQTFDFMPKSAAH